jgi:hypothetical protein
VEEIEENERGWHWGLTFLHNIKFSSFGELTNCIGGGFWRVYMNSSNLILKLKI